MQQITGSVLPQSVAFLGSDMPDLRPRFEVAEGGQVTPGQAVFRDRRHPSVAYVAPVAGTVAQLAYGPRRTLSVCVIETCGDVAESEPAPLKIDASDARATLLTCGMWPAFRTRPFGRTPDPGAEPAAICINAVHSAPQAPDPKVVLDPQMDAFRLGVSLLTQLATGQVFVCQSRGEALVTTQDRVTCASFSGSVAAGQAGTQIDRLCPVRPGSEVWSIGYQDVAAIGHLFQTGQYVADRVVSIAGPLADRPRLVKTCVGANIADIAGAASQALSGDLYSGRAALFLGRFDQQITLIEKAAPRVRRAWLSRVFDTQGAVIPTEALERALALDIPTVPLLRALSIGDSEAAERLGCLALVEEDVAALSRRCTSGADYGRLLRDVLDDLMADAA